MPAVAVLSNLMDEPLEWGKEALEMLRRDYYLPKSKLYSEKPDKKQPAFNWGVGVMLSALNAAAQVDAKYRPWLREYADATRVYWNDGGYDVLPAPKPKDRYYDDNAWMALALLETHQVLGDQKYLDWSQQALEFALAGRAKDGGVYWRESDRASRNTCSCAPVAAACFLMYKQTKEQRYLFYGKEIFDWTSKHLRDPKDGLMWDNISNSGKIEKTKWTYNSALMIRAHDLLKGLDPKTADDYGSLAPAATKRWLPEGKTISDPGRFSHLLFEALLWHDEPFSKGAYSGDLPGAKYLEILRNVRSARNAKGHYPVDWKKFEVADNPEILDQAAFARACFVLRIEMGRPR